MCSRTRSFAGIATGFAVDGPDARNVGQTAVHRSISRSAPSFETWRLQIRCGKRRGFTASSARSASTCQNARCHVCWNRTHVRPRRHGGRFSRTTSRQPRRCFFHRSDSHRPTAVRPGRAVTSPPADRALQHHGTSDSHVVRSANGRSIPGRHRAQVVASRPGQRLWRRLPAATAGMGIAEVVSAPASPWQNPYVERLIGSIRRECLDHVLVLNEAHLRRVLTTYCQYYHRSRTHLGLAKDAPDHRYDRRWRGEAPRSCREDHLATAGSARPIRRSEAPCCRPR